MQMANHLNRREFMRVGVGAGLAAAFGAPALGQQARPTVRFGITADCHILGRDGDRAALGKFVEEMKRWKPDFVFDLGDFACQAGSGQTTPAMHDSQLEGLRRSWALLAESPCPAYIAMGNHCVGWIKGGNEKITPDDLYAKPHGGEDITKDEFLAVTKMPRRYYSFDVKGYHFIVLDPNNSGHALLKEAGRTEDEIKAVLGHDGVVGAYYLDEPQRKWLAEDLAANREKTKIVFSHEELHFTGAAGGEGGDIPFPQYPKFTSYCGNGWQARELFKADGKVLACFAGHKHQNRWTVHGGTNFITLKATHAQGSYAKVTISDMLQIDGHSQQRSYKIPLSGIVAEVTRTAE